MPSNIQDIRNILNMKNINYWSTAEIGDFYFAGSTKLFFGFMNSCEIESTSGSSSMNKTISISKTTSDSSPQASPHPPLCSPPLLLPSFILENKKIYNTRLHNREKVWHFHNFHKVDLNSRLWSVRHWTPLASS